jgi:hypothetical protein
VSVLMETVQSVKLGMAENHRNIPLEQGGRQLCKAGTVCIFAVCQAVLLDEHMRSGYRGWQASIGRR